MPRVTVTATDAGGQKATHTADYAVAAPTPPAPPLSDSYGVCVHPNFLQKPHWADTATWMQHAADLGFTQIRGMFNERNAGCRRALDLCRQHGIRWLMTLVPPTWNVSPEEAAARIHWLADNGWGDVVLGFEGPNEPDTSGAADWPERTLAAQRAIFETARSRFPDVPVLSPSMHDNNQDKLDGAGYRALADLDIRRYVDAASLHSYPRGSEVLTKLDDRLALVDLAYAGLPVWITETGWTTYNKTSSGGPVPTTEADAAAFGAEAPATIAAHPRVERAFRYELLDDPGDGTDPETRFGLVRPDGTFKPEADALRELLA